MVVSWSVLCTSSYTVNVVVCFLLYKRTVPGVVARGHVFCVLVPPPLPILRRCLDTSRFCDLFFSTWTGFLLQGHRFVCIVECICFERSNYTKYTYCWTRIPKLMLHMLVGLIASLHVHVYCTHVVLHTLLISLARSSVNFLGNQEFRNSELGIEL